MTDFSSLQSGEASSSRYVQKQYLSSLPNQLTNELSVLGTIVIATIPLAIYPHKWGTYSNKLTCNCHEFL